MAEQCLVVGCRDLAIVALYLRLRGDETAVAAKGSEEPMIRVPLCHAHKNVRRDSVGIDFLVNE